ncbi:MAG: thioredoxin family protein [Planctomycetes bacterium]|nr:thioredoxin family protein [Planctomycetota bacterium]
MKKIQVLGAGCAKCTKLAERTQQAARQLGLQFELEKVTDVTRFADFGVMAVPALVVDGVVVSSGRLPTVAELEQLLA